MVFPCRSSKLFDETWARDLLTREPWTPTPLLPAQVIGSKLGVDLWLKREDCTPAGSFKLRGALATFDSRADSLSEEGVYVASSGNYGLAIAIAGQARGVPVTVVVPENAAPGKLDRIRLCDATVVRHGKDFDYAKEFARETALRQGAAFWEDGVVEEMGLGAGTIAAEVLDHSRPWDTVLVPLGNGSLIKGVATVFKSRSPETQVVGLVPEGAPAMAHAVRGDPLDETAALSTSADGLAVRIPIPEIVEELKTLVDDVWLVEESKVLTAVKSLIELEHVMVEPSSAITMAGLVDHHEDARGKRVVAILTGAHLDPQLIPTVMAGAGLL